MEGFLSTNPRKGTETEPPRVTETTNLESFLSTNPRKGTETQ